MKKLKLWSLIALALVGLAACSSADTRNNSDWTYERFVRERPDPGYMRR